MMSIRKHCFRFGLLAVAGLALSGSASAQSARLSTIDANGGCIPNSGGTPLQQGSLLANSSTTSTMYADCSLPITTASVAEAAEGGTFFGYVVNNSTTDNLTCTFKVVSPTGFVLMNVTQLVESASPGQTKVIPYNSFQFHVNAPTYMSCKIPKAQAGHAFSGVNGVSFLYTVWPD